MSTFPQNIASESLHHPLPDGTTAETAPAGGTEWKQQLNERLAAHRSRREKREAEQSSLPLEVERPPVRSRARVAARVAQRYAKAPAYSEVLAREEKQEDSLQVEADFGDGETLPGDAIPTGLPAAVRAQESSAQAAMGDELFREHLHPGAAGRDGKHMATSGEGPALRENSSISSAREDADTDHNEDHNEGSGEGSSEAGGGGATEWIPGNLIEFPRVLVAPRKARPRLAEGPLREDATMDTDPAHSQLRIFEVEQQAISIAAQVEPIATEWSSIRLDARPPELSSPYPGRQEKAGSRRGRAAPAPARLQTASIPDRLMAGLVDGALVTLGFIAFVAVFVACTAHPPAGRPALIAAGCTLFVFFLFFQYLFFTFSEGTPGMRYAKIALCTFDDENPTRPEMRRRIGALLLSACPVALGFVWAWFDEDRLGWHDRISRTYQRSYR